MTNSNVRFAYSNYLADAATIIYDSTERTGFELANISGRNAMTRWNEWRPRGDIFHITEGNRKLYFNSTTNRTVTIATGEYTGTELATALNAALSALVGLSGSTCTYSNTTYRFTIIIDAPHTMQFSNQDEAIWDTIGFEHTDNVFIGSAGYNWVGLRRIHTEEHLYIDLGVARPVDFFCVLPSASETFGVGEGATAYLTASGGASVETIPLTRTDAGIFHFLDALPSTNHRYWRYTFSDRTNPNGPSSFGHAIVYLGSYTTLDGRSVGRGFQKSFVDLSEVQTAVGGARFALTRPRLARYSGMNITAMSNTDRLALETLYNTVGNYQPFFLSLDPQVRVSDSLDQLTLLAQFDSFNLQHIKTNIYSLSMSMTETV